MSTLAVCVPARNRAALLPAALDSILRQTRLPDALVVSDDGSSDGTPSVIAAYVPLFQERGVDVRAFRHDVRLGQEENRRFCFERAEADLVAMLDDDDLWRPTFLERVAGLLEATPDAAFAACNLDIIDLAGEVDASATAYENAVNGRKALCDGVYADFLHMVVNRMVFTLQSTVFRRSALANIGFVPKGSMAACDRAVFYEFGMAGVHAAYVSDSLACYRVYEGPRSYNEGVARMSPVCEYLEHLSDRARTAEQRYILQHTAVDYHRDFVMELGHAGRRREATLAAVAMARKYGLQSLGRRVFLHLPLVLLGADRIRRHRPLPKPVPPDNVQPV